MLKKIKVEMELERETKGAVLYKGDYNGAMQNIYVKKFALPTPPPKTIMVEVEFEG